MKRFWMVFFNGTYEATRYEHIQDARIRARALANTEPEQNAIVMEAAENWVSPVVPASEEGFDD